MPGINDPGTGPLVGPGGPVSPYGSVGGMTVRQTYPWTQATGGGARNIGAQLAGLGGIDFNALLEASRRAKIPPRPQPQLGQVDLHALNMQRARDANEMAQIQAMTRPAPTKMTYVGASPGFLELDPFAMNAYQRQAFLPQGANFYGPTGNEAAAQGREESRRALFEQPLWQLNQWAAMNSILNPTPPPQPQKKEQGGGGSIR